MQPHQQRVVEEKAQLDERIGELQSFISRAPQYSVLPADEQGRLRTQLDLMSKLSDVLAARINAFT